MPSAPVPSNVQILVMKSNPSIQQAAVLPAKRRVLNVGSGPPSNRYLHAVFLSAEWQETRLDVDPLAAPDLVGSFVNMGGLVESEDFDAVWSSHSLEHLYAHEVPLALAEFRRILKPDGFALITCPDLEAVASLILKQGLDHEAYVSPMGPITPHDMLFGHSGAIARGKTAMSHNTGFTCSSLGHLLANAGFPVVLVKRDYLDLWALALMPAADKLAIQTGLQASGLDMLDEQE